MSDIREWLFLPLKQIEDRVRLETGDRPYIEIEVSEAVFTEAVAAADIRYGIISGPPGKLPDAVHLGDFVVIRKREPQSIHVLDDQDIEAITGKKLGGK